jgi:choline dehydrogenase-like flavoprotein
LPLGASWIAEDLAGAGYRSIGALPARAVAPLTVGVRSRPVAVGVVLSEIQRDTLRDLCDTLVPSLAVPGDKAGFYARSASDLGVPEAVEQALGAQVPGDQLAGLRSLLDAIADEGFADAAPPEREAVVQAFMDAGPESLAGMSAFKGLALMLFYALPDPQTGRNPNWEAIGYPGPVSAPPDVPKPIVLVRPTTDEMVLDADVCVVGSGAGGGVIAGTLAVEGKHVIVLELGGYFNESDFNQLELWAYENLFYGGGLLTTDTGSIGILAGTGLGGGTTVNWTNCIRTRDDVREQWEREFGLEGVAGPDYEAHLDAVWGRLGVNDRCSDYNGPHQRLQEACEALGYEFVRITRNADPETYDPETAGFMSFGDQSGSKRGTLKTYLQDAFDRGAQIVARCNAERILVDAGRAVGVEGTYTDPEDGHVSRVIVRAPQVVAACGALATPALLLRSGIGGRAVGDYLRLHPAGAVLGLYDEPQRPWWGPPQAALTPQFADLEDGFGFLVESAPTVPGLQAGSVPWHGGRIHKDWMAEGANASGLIFFIRDRGNGRVTIDRDGNSVWSYRMTDRLDDRHFRRGQAELVRLHDAAGARGLISYQRKVSRWDRDSGEPAEPFAQRLHDASYDPYEIAKFSAHQMGSARMGNNPKTSVADPWGELHDTPGVWIGDSSALPTAPGTNPMITIMALARRTATAMAAAR